MDQNPKDAPHFIAWTNLLLLGFDPEAEKKAHNVDFHSHMFKTSNSKGMEVVFYFLFNKIQAPFLKQFKKLWPSLDKDQSREFKKQIGDNLLALEKAGCWPPNLVRASIISTAGGEKFNTILWHFSTYVMKTVLKKVHEKYPVPFENGLSTFAPSDSPFVRNALIRHIEKESRDFVRFSMRVVEAQKQWTVFNDELDRQLHSLEQTHNHYSFQREALEHEVLDEPFQKSLLNKANHLRETFESIQRFTESTQEQRAIIETCLHQKANPHRLHISELNFNPPQLTHRSNQEKQTKKSEKMELQYLLETWLECFEDLPKATGNIASQESVQFLNSNLQLHQKHLNNLRELNYNLERQESRTQTAIEEQDPDPLKTPTKNTLQFRPVPPTPQTKFTIQVDKEISHSEGSAHLTPEILKKLKGSVNRFKNSGSTSRQST